MPNWSSPADRWAFHPISSKGDYGTFTHGIGYGDVNGDGRTDILEARGWWEQPASLAGDPVWQFHKFQFASRRSHMYAYDINGDGLSDVITALDAHGYGLVWYEQGSATRTAKFNSNSMPFSTRNPARTSTALSFLSSMLWNWQIWTEMVSKTS